MNYARISPARAGTLHFKYFSEWPRSLAAGCVFRRVTRAGVKRSWARACVSPTCPMAKTLSEGYRTLHDHTDEPYLELVEPVR